MKRIVVLLAVVLITGTAYGAVGDVWSLSGDMQNVSNPGPAIDPGAAGGGTGFWTYHTGPTIFPDPAIVANNVNPEVPDAGIGWVAPATNWIMLVKFTVDANSLNGDKTNFKTGDVGGHAATGATWTTDHRGGFQVDYLGYNARDQQLATGNEGGRQTSLQLTVAGVVIDSKLITGGIEDGKANAYTNTVIVALAAGETIDLQQVGADWSGLDMTITEIVEPPVCTVPPAADLDGNCWVNILDFALFSSEWLTCGIQNFPSVCFQ